MTKMTPELRTCVNNLLAFGPAGRWKFVLQYFIVGMADAEDVASELRSLRKGEPESSDLSRWIEEVLQAIAE